MGVNRRIGEENNALFLRGANQTFPDNAYNVVLIAMCGPSLSNHQRKSVISFVIYNLSNSLCFGQLFDTIAFRFF